MVNQLQQQFEKDARSKLDGLRENLSHTTERFRYTAEMPIFRSMRFHQLTLNKPNLQNDIRQLELYFLELQQADPELKTVRYIDEKGTEVLRIEKSSIAQDLADLSHKHEVRKALELTHGEVRVTVLLNEDNEASELIWWVSVFPALKVSTGVLGFHMSFDSLLDRVKSLGSDKEHVRLEDEEGNMLFDTRIARQRGKFPKGQWNIQGTLGVPGLSWKVVLSADPADFLEDVASLRWQVFVIILPVIIILSFIGIIFTTRQITGRIKGLVRAAKIIGSGNLDYKIEVKTKDELGELSVAFNQMAINRKQAEKLIETSRDYLQKLNDSLGAAIFTVKMPERVIEYVNCAVESIFGYKPDECIGKETKMLYLTVEEYHDFGRLLKSAIKEGKNKLRVEKLFKRKDGKIIPCEITTTFLRENEKIVRVISILHDITERKRMEEELVKMQKLESIGILAGGIAHDFNNSLQAILSTISVAKLYVNPEDEVYKRLTDAEKITIQSKGLSQQLLTFSKGGNPIRKTIFISELIKNSVNLAMSGSNVRCELGIPNDLWSVEGDKGQLNQVIGNLIINADQAMPEGGNIKVWAENINVVENDLLPVEEGKYVRITIKDQGAGISHEHLQKIFDPYFTTKDESSGLGLTITYSIIKKHGGHITVESEIGVGTTFYIYLPASQKGIPKARVEGEVDKKNIEKITSLNERRILFMEDETIISLAVARQLRNLNYEVETARDGFEAIELYQRAMKSSKPFNVVILDLTIPGGMGGEETIKKLLEIDHNVKAVVASGYANDPIMANFEESGFRSVVEKPYEIAELDEVLQKVIMEKQT